MDDWSKSHRKFHSFVLSQTFPFSVTVSTTWSTARRSTERIRALLRFMASSLDSHNRVRRHRANPRISQFGDDRIHRYLDPWILEKLRLGQGDFCRQLDSRLVVTALSEFALCYTSEPHPWILEFLTKQDQKLCGQILTGISIHGWLDLRMTWFPDIYFHRF